MMEKRSAYECMRFALEGDLYDWFAGFVENHEELVLHIALDFGSIKFTANKVPNWLALSHSSVRHPRKSGSSDMYKCL